MGGIICISEVIDISPGNLDSSLCFIQSSTNRTLCTRTHVKGAVTPKETDLDLPVSVQESPVEAWVSGGLLQGREH